MGAGGVSLTFQPPALAEINSSPNWTPPGWCVFLQGGLWWVQMGTDLFHLLALITAGQWWGTSWYWTLPHTPASLQSIASIIEEEAEAQSCTAPHSTPGEAGGVFAVLWSLADFPVFAKQ